jgi:uncharacterized protein YbjT (DUF2867 family)
MYVVAGATGHTGQVVAETLLDRKQPVRVIVRDEAKGAPWKARGVEVAVAALEDPQALARALAGADGVYALVPPDYRAAEPLAAQRRVVESWASAIEAAKPKHVVLLSSIGAQLPAGTGPIRGLHYAEERFARLPTALTALRAAYFLENWGGVLEPVTKQGVLPSMLTPDRQVPMVATADIGRVAVELLLKGPSSKGVVELASVDHSPQEIGALFGRLLERPIQVVPVPEQGIVPALKAAGFTDGLAELFREMNVGLNQGHIKFTGTPVRGQVSAETVLRKLLGR